MARAGVRARAIERIGQVCAAHDDALALRVALLGELRRVVGFDAHAWLLTDPETEVGGAPLADVPCLPELPRLIRLKYLTPVNRWTGLDGAVATLRSATGGRPERSLVWRELLAGHDVGDVASLVLRDRFGCWAFLDLWRLGAGASFDEDDARLLAAVAPALTDALRRCAAGTFSLVGPPAAGREGPAVMVLSPDLEVRVKTPGTDAYLRLLVPPDGDSRPIPAGAYNVAAQLLATEAGVDAHPPRVRVHLAAGAWLTLRAARMDDGGDVPLDARDIAVTIERASPAERLDLFARSHGLTARETELLGLLADGADTRRVAQELFLSEHTVQDHLKSIFERTGTRSRRALVARAAGR